MAEDKTKDLQAEDKTKDLQAENEALKTALADAHNEIKAAEAKAPEQPILTISKSKYRLVIPKAKYPVSKHVFREVTLAVLKEDKKFAEKLVKENYSGLVLINPEKE